MLAPPAKAEDVLFITRASLSAPPPYSIGVVEGRACTDLLWTFICVFLYLWHSGAERRQNRKGLDTEGKKKSKPRKEMMRNNF